MATSTREHYDALFAEIANEFGPVDEATSTGIIGFSAGGPVSMSRVGSGGRYVTCELSLYPEQVESSEGLKFELLALVGLEQDECQRLLTALGALSMSETLGDLHTIDVSQAVESVSSVQLRLQSQCKISGRGYGVYGVVPVGA
jgi:hypothetical protein